MLKIKNSVALITLPFFIAACGGGGGSDSGNASAPSSPASNRTPVPQTLFDGEKTLYAYNVQQDDDFSVWGSTKTEWSLDQGVLYEKTANPAFNPYIVTEKGGLYVPETRESYDAIQGFRHVFVQSVGETEWVTTPYNQAGLRELKMTRTFRVIDLNGVRISEQLVPFAPVLYDLWTARGEQAADPEAFISRLGASQDVFPAGAKCIQMQSVKAGAVSLQFNPDPALAITGVRNLQGWAEQEKIAGNVSSANPVIETWGGLRVGYLVKDGTDNTGTEYLFAIEYQGQVYRAYPSDGSWSLDAFINALSNELKQGNSYTELINIMGADDAESYVNQTIEVTRNKCDFYNTAAAENIDTLLDKLNGK
ncbi:hypothetical protein [Acinetobacter sp. WZC-1]|uniref:hypothetical protein n=1 Tax=Acinetobacter sp. WZC-1 TaxID=3459034 RepID=UPI00403DC3A3